MVEVPDRIARLVGRVDEIRGVVECPVCGTNKWEYGLAPLAVPQMSPNPERRGLSVFPYICVRCGYVRLHSIDHLENPREESH